MINVLVPFQHRNHDGTWRVVEADGFRLAIIRDWKLNPARKRPYTFVQNDQKGDVIDTELNYADIVWLTGFLAGEAGVLNLVASPT